MSRFVVPDGLRKHLGDDCVREQAEMWGKDENISEVNLSAHKIGTGAAEALGNALRRSLSITTLDCSLNPALGDEGARLLVPALRTDGTGISTIRKLSLMRCGIGVVGATALAQGLRRNSVLERLNLTGNCLGDLGTIALAGSLVGPSRGFLLGLWLSSNGIGPIGAEGFAEGLAKAPALRELHISGNALGGVGVAILVRGAVQGRGLRGLYASGCGVDNAGAKEIANALKGSRHLDTLCLGYNLIGDDGVSALTREVAENNSLKRLLLSSNCLRAAGGKAIAAMLLSNCGLLCLDVSNNRLSATGIEAVATAVAKNTTLLELDLSGCGGTEASFQAMTRAVEANNTLGVLLYADNHLSADSLIELEYAMGRPKRSVREVMMQVQRAIDKQDLLSNGQEIRQSTKGIKRSQGREPSVTLGSGQETSVQVSFGRKDNIIGSITVTNETCLEEARALIAPLLRPSERTYGFLSAAGGLIPSDDEQARRVVWDCKIPVQLRPASWVAIEHI